MKEKPMQLSSGARVGIPRARARFLTQAIELEESDAPGIVGVGVFLTALLVGGVIAWSSITELSEVSRSPGEVVPAGLINRVQHLEGGIVQDIHVRNGDRVEVGAPLVSLAPSATRSELEQLEARQAGLRLRLARVNALLEGREPRFGELDRTHPALAARQRALYRDQSASRREQLELADAQVAQRASEIDSLAGQLAAAREEIKLLDQLQQMRATLAQQQIVARAEVINVAVRQAEAVRDLRELQGRERVAAHALAEARQARVELESRLRETYSREAGELTTQLADVHQALVRTRDRVNRLVVRAPVAGIVKGLAVNTVNSVIDPGEVIAEIVPVGEALIVESRVSTSDVGHVHPGQAVEVRVSSYESTRFGTVRGTLQRVSASTYLDAGNRPYYRAEISLHKPYLGDDPNRHRIIPGMQVQANIVTGHKSILDYILKPVYRGFQSAFRER